MNLRKCPGMYKRVANPVEVGSLSVRGKRPRATCPECGKNVAMLSYGFVGYHLTDRIPLPKGWKRLVLKGAKR